MDVTPAIHFYGIQILPWNIWHLQKFEAAADYLFLQHGCRYLDVTIKAYFWKYAILSFWQHWLVTEWEQQAYQKKKDLEVISHVFNIYKFFGCGTVSAQACSSSYISDKSLSSIWSRQLLDDYASVRQAGHEPRPFYSCLSTVWWLATICSSTVWWLAGSFTYPTRDEYSGWSYSSLLQPLSGESLAIRYSYGYPP